jgi:GMP synthase PP-ATPase subunit
MENKLRATELFATPQDIVRAHQIVEEELGPDFDINYLGLPKNIGEHGDQGYYGHSLVISAATEADKRGVFDASQQSIKEAHPLLAKVSKRLTNETGAATKVLIDITPNGGYFEIDRP